MTARRDDTANLMDEIASDEVLEQAYRWLCDRRKRYSPNSDVWTLRWRWREVKPAVQEALLSGNYRLEAAQRIARGIVRQLLVERREIAPRDRRVVLLLFNFG